MIMGSVLTQEAAVQVNAIAEQEGFAAVLRQLAIFAQQEMEIIDGSETASILYILAKRLTHGERPGRLNKLRK